MPLWKWSRTAASNANADPTINWAEGMAPSTVNDSARAEMAAVAKWRDDISGAITTGGTSTAYTVTSYSGFTTAADLAGQIIAFTPNATNTGAVTLNVDGIGAAPLRPSPSVEFIEGSLLLGTPYVAVYSSADSCFYLQNGQSNPYNIPLGGMMDWTFSTAPNSAFAMPYGQTLSRTTYAALWTKAQIEIAAGSLLYTNGNGTTTFGILDMRGRVSACPDNMGGSQAGRLNSGAMASVANILGGSGGTATSTLVTANLPAYTPVGSITNGAITAQFVIDGNPALAAIAGWSIGNGDSGAGTSFPNIQGTSGNLGAFFTQQASGFTGTAQGGTSTPTNITQPTIIVPKILRII